MSDQTRIIMDELKILDFFHELKKEQSPVLLWTKVSEGPERKLFYCHVQHSNLVDHEIGFLNHDKSSPFSDFCSDKADIFVYSDSDSMLLKTTIKRFNSDLIIVDFPKKINIVAEAMKLNIHKTIEALDTGIKKQRKQTQTKVGQKDEFGIEIELPEDQKKYQNLRASPRGKADDGQVAKTHVKKSTKLIETCNNQVFDISRGGISLLSHKPHEFEVEDEVVVLTINDEEPPFSLEGDVVSIKRIDLNEVVFLVGIKFHE